MAVRFAYGDDSGTHTNGAQFTNVLGYLASPRQWKAFRRDWRIAIGEVEEFHAKDFFSRSAWKSHNSPYHGWTDYKARQFLNALLEVIDKYRLKPIGGAVDVQAFFSYPPEDRHWITGAVLLTYANWKDGELIVRDKLTMHESSPNRPYAVVMPGLFVESLMDHNDKVWVTLDEQGAWENRAKDYYDQYKKNSPHGHRLVHFGFASSAQELPLQAADLYAYVWNAKLHDNLDTPDLQRAFDVLTRKKKWIVVINHRYLGELLEKRDQNRQEGISRAEATPHD